MHFRQTAEKIFSAVTSPTAYSWYGVGGVVATSVLTFFATKKYCEKRYLEKETTRDEYFNSYEEPCGEIADYEPENTKTIGEKLEDVKDTAFIFVKPAASLLATIYFIRKSDLKSKEFISGLARAYNNNSLKLERYRSMASGALLAEAKEKLNAKERDQEDIPYAQDHAFTFAENDFEHENYGDILHFYDEMSEEYFDSTIVDVLLAEGMLNHVYANDEFASLGMWYDLIGHPEFKEKIPNCKCLGWNTSAGWEYGYRDIRFKHERTFDQNGDRLYTIYIMSPPTMDVDLGL